MSEKMDPVRPVASYEIDSLVAVEFKNREGREPLGRTILRGEPQRCWWIRRLGSITADLPPPNPAFPTLFLSDQHSLLRLRSSCRLQELNGKAVIVTHKLTNSLNDIIKIGDSQISTLKIMTAPAAKTRHSMIFDLISNLFRNPAKSIALLQINKKRLGQWIASCNMSARLLFKC